MGRSPRGEALPPSRQNPTPVAPFSMMTSYTPGDTSTAGVGDVGDEEAGPVTDGDGALPDAVESSLVSSDQSINQSINQSVNIALLPSIT